ncbi:MAG TPA: autotransporter domain-containing protein, partial [Bosea sp. (in: a-proteobacteria)]|nr:autotransporter domain-containing protein [Bosea sp. (in: a-proteobacteria)]
MSPAAAPGGAGGVDNPTGPGGAGGRGRPFYMGGPYFLPGDGGGGAGAGVGGAGGLGGGRGGVHGYVGAALPSGGVIGIAGGDGAPSDGGGGGGFGAVVSGAGTSGTISEHIVAGNGGKGGAGDDRWDAGSGGSGGIGLMFTDAGTRSSVTVATTVRGGDGGAAGAAWRAPGRAGNGGAGLVGSNLSIVNNGRIFGGYGGAAPARQGGTGGLGGEGIVGSDLSIINNGTISGASSGDRQIRAASIRFTGGANSLTFGNATAGLGLGTIVIEAGTLTFAQPTDTALDSIISGAGSVIKTGAGTLTLLMANFYTGDTTVVEGRLVVNGRIPGRVILAGGTLGGSGMVGELIIDSNATVAPGNSIGTLTVAGNVGVAAGSIYQLEIGSPGQSDRLVALGRATISGGTLQVLAGSDNSAAGASYTVLTAAGGVTGRFDDVTSNLAFLSPSLGYDSNNVILTMTRNNTAFGPDSSGRAFVASTRNQGFIANAAERLGAGNPVYDALLSGTAAEARAGFDSLSGEAHAQAISVMIDESRLVRETILSHLRRPLLTQAPGQVAGDFSANLPGRKGGVAMPAPIPQPRYSFWGEAFGGTGNTDADGNAASQSRRTGGGLLGADLMVYDAPGSSLKVGIAGGYSQSRFDLDARRSSGRLESGHAALYAGARFGNLRLDAGAAYTWSESDIRRQVQIRGFSDSLRLQRPGEVAQGFAELGYAFAFKGFALEPFAQLALIRVSTDAGTERGGAAALRVLSSEQSLGFTTLGLRAEAQIGAMPLFARAMLGWRHGFGELTPQARTAFVAGATPARVFAAPIDREALVAEAGLDWRISQATAL